MNASHSNSTSGSSHFYTARALLLRTGQVRVANLQSHLRLGYTPTLLLLESLEREGIVTPINAAGFRTLTAIYLTPPAINPELSARDAYISDLHATALHWFELFEEGHRGHSDLPKSVAPECFSGTALRNYLCDELYGKRAYSITEAALALSEWQPEGVTLPFTAADVRKDIIDRCAPDERLRHSVTDVKEETTRAFRRYAREIVRLVTENRARSAHTRLIEYFVRGDLVPRGLGHKYQESGVGKHGEHVVPLAYLRDKACELVREGWHVDDVAKIIRHFTAVVDITTQEAKMLDHGITLGGLALKANMPEGWQFDKGCAFDRLHAAGIYFDFPSRPKTCPSCLSA